MEELEKENGLLRIQIILLKKRLENQGKKPKLINPVKASDYDEVYFKGLEWLNTL